MTTAPQGPHGLAAWGAGGAPPAGNASGAAAGGGDGALGAADGGVNPKGSAGEDGDPLRWGYVGVAVAPDGHAGALVELARATERGAPLPQWYMLRIWGLGCRWRPTAARARWRSWCARPSAVRRELLSGTWSAIRV